MRCQNEEPTHTSFKQNENPWFNEQCEKSRFYFYQMLNKYRESKTEENRTGMITARSAYKSTLRKSRYVFDKEKTVRLNSARYKNAKYIGIC